MKKEPEGGKVIDMKEEGDDYSYLTEVDWYDLPFEKMVVRSDPIRLCTVKYFLLTRGRRKRYVDWVASLVRGRKTPDWAEQPSEGFRKWVESKISKHQE